MLLIRFLLFILMFRWLLRNFMVVMLLGFMMCSWWVLVFFCVCLFSVLV